MLPNCLEDFEADLASWIDMGDQIVVCGDFNHHVLDDPIVSMFARYDMSNLIFDLHDPTPFPPSSGKGDSSRQVDAIFGTASLVVTQAGYLDTTEHPGDHHPLWIDVTYQSALGHPPITAPSPTHEQTPAEQCQV